MTGRRPDTTQVWNLEDNWRVRHQDWTSLPGMLKNEGFKSLGSGKTYHDTVQGDLNDAIFQYDGRRSWSEEALPYRNPCWYEGVDCAGCPGTHWTINNVSEDWCIRETGDMSDVRTIEIALDLLRTAVQATKNDSTPFYLAVGLHKPHMPWIAKQEHFDLYPLETITLSSIPTMDRSIPEIAYFGCESPSPYEPIPDHQARLARRAYYAATTGMDEQLGILLAALAESGVAHETAIILHGDHGWHLGDRGEWRKNTNWDAALRTPLIIKVPWITGLAGTRTAALAELVDVMPTMADLMDISLPNTTAGDRLHPPEGMSLVPVLRAVAATATATAADAAADADAVSATASTSTGVEDVPLMKKAAFSQTARCPKHERIPWYSNGCDHHAADSMSYMGYSVRVSDWRYTEWRPWNGTSLSAVWSLGWPEIQRELYDHRDEDPTMTNYDLSEIVNVVLEVEHTQVVHDLSAILRNQFFREAS